MKGLKSVILKIFTVSKYWILSNDPNPDLNHIVFKKTSHIYVHFNVYIFFLGELWYKELITNQLGSLQASPEMCPIRTFSRTKGLER